MTDDRWAPYLFDGLLSTQPFANGNMAGATATALTYLDLYNPGEMMPIEGTLALGLSTLCKAYGTLSRYPGVLTNTSIDDYIAVIAAHSGFAREWLMSGALSLGFYDVNRPGQTSINLKQWLWRFPGLRAHAAFSANMSYLKPNGLDYSLWNIAITRAADQPITNQDGWMQSHLMVLKYERSIHRTPALDEAATRWWAKKPASMKEIVAAYIAIPDHPLIDITDEYKE